MARLVGVVVSVVAVAVVAAYALALVATLVVLYGAYRGGRALWRRHRQNVALAEHQRAELLARAELQHRWYLDGDPRGTYGRYVPARVQG
ncbi:hypothetical protein ACNQR7_27000 [Mycolicibacterium senegalense]|uniref:hypothetical protein n=1 Tax=Mycolicibacterium TaxID=1866885 RepID=UPI003204E992